VEDRRGHHHVVRLLAKRNLATKDDLTQDQVPESEMPKNRKNYCSNASLRVTFNLQNRQKFSF